MAGFVFIQKGTDTHVPRASVPGLAVRHLQYISTRPGAIYNQDCGFSLWGKLKPFAQAQDIRDLEGTKKLLRQEAERGRTIYRAVISLGEPEASREDYYRREPWEALTRSQASVIAKKLHIQPENFRWLASMHYAQGHPHVHLIYWDAGSEPRKEYMPPKKFREYSESIRISLNQAAFGISPEIRQMQAQQKDATQELRLELRAMCLECNPSTSFQLKKMLGSPELQAVAEQLNTLAADLPSYGSAKFAYMPERYKAKVTELVGYIKTLEPFQKPLKRYFSAVESVSRLYGNSPETVQRQLDKATEKLDRALCNEVMAAVRDVRQELAADRPQSPEEMRALAREALEALVLDTPEYQALRDMLPADRVPLEVMEQTPGFRQAKEELLRGLLNDARVKGRLVSKDKALQKENFAAFLRAADRELTDTLRGQQGYTLEAVATASARMLCQMLGLAARMSGQQQATSALAHRRSRDRSREAKKDQAQRRAQGEDWTPDI